MRGAKYIQRMLQHTGMTQEDLANEMGKSQGLLNQYINIERMEEHHGMVVKFLEDKVRSSFGARFLGRLRKENAQS